MATLSQGQMAGLAQSYGLSPANAQLAAAIAMAESHGKTDVTRITAYEYSVGLWQINLYAHPEYNFGAMETPDGNASAMAKISNGGTIWTEWGAYTDGSYKQYYHQVTPTPYPSSGSAAGASTVKGTSKGGGVSNLSSTVKTNPATTEDVGSAWAYILAYIVAGLIFVFIARFEAGYNALYYLAVLFLMLLLLTQSVFIANAISPITGVNAKGQPVDTTGRSVVTL